MIKQIGRFVTDKDNIIHIHSIEERIELFSEIDLLSKKYLRDLPEVKEEFELSCNKSN